jgi:hypothetical protein
MPTAPENVFSLGNTGNDRRPARTTWLALTDEIQCPSICRLSGVDRKPLARGQIDANDRPVADEKDGTIGKWCWSRSQIEGGIGVGVIRHFTTIVEKWRITLR